MACVKVTKPQPGVINGPALAKTGLERAPMLKAISRFEFAWPGHPPPKARSYFDGMSCLAGPPANEEGLIRCRAGG